MPTQAQLDAFTRKWNKKFADNEFQNIRESTFREFSTDIVATFGVSVATVPAYQAGITYQKGFLVRYTPLNGQEAFYYALNAGVLTAPGPGNTTDWKVVPGPVLPTELSQTITLVQAQGLDQTSVLAGRTYLVEFGLNAKGYQQTIAVRGVSNNAFDIVGTLEVNGQRTAVTNVNVQAGTWQVVGALLPRHDAYPVPAAGAQSITLAGATFVWSVGKRGLNGTLDLLSYGSGWTFANSQVQLLAAANVPAQAVIELVHNGTGLGGATPGTPPPAPTNPVTDNPGHFFTFNPATSTTGAAPVAPGSPSTSGSTFLFTPSTY